MSDGKEQTPTEVLVAAMEEVSEAEECMIILVNRDGSICWHTSCNRTHRKLGMVELVAASLRGQVIKGS